MENMWVKLFPFIKLFTNSFGEMNLYDIVTSIFVLVLIISFFFFLVRYLLQYFKIPHKITNEDQLRNHTILSKIWDEYKATFKKSNKTYCEAEEFYNYENVFNKVINLRFYESLPNLFIGVGILGTFFGLTLGIANFDTSTTETIKESISLLLSGMSTAFVTSVWGMLFSVIFNATEKATTRTVSKTMDKVCANLNNEYKLTEIEVEELRISEIKNVLNEYLMIQDNDGNDILLTNLVLSSQKELEQQTGALKSFSTDLADGIRISTETVLALGDKIGNIFSQTIQREFKPVLENLDASVKELKDTKEESAGKLVEEMIGKLELAISELVGNFQKSIDGNTTSYFEDLGTTIGSFITMLEGYPETMKSMMTSFTELMGNQEEKLKGISSSTSVDVITTMSLIKDEVEQTIRTFKDQIGTLNDKLGNLQSQQDNSTNKVDNLLSSANETITKFENITQQLNTFKNLTNSTLEQINSASQSFNEISSSNKTISSQLNNSANLLGSRMDSFYENFKLSSQNYSEFVSNTKSLIDKFEDEVKELSSSIEEAFTNLDDGLKIYTTTTREQLNTNLADFTNQFSNSSSVLKEAIQYLEEVVSDLSDKIDKKS